jgi:hypothetical protein
VARKTKRKRGRRKLPPVGNDSPIVWGAAAIADYLGRTLSQVYFLHRERRIPTRSVGAIIVARKADLDNPATWPGQGGAA